MVNNTPIVDLKGAHVALITPMFNNGSIDYRTFERLIEDQIFAGIDGILVNGTTGQSPTIKNHEVVHLVEDALQVIKGRVPLMIGAGKNDTAAARDLTTLVENKIGPTTFLHVTGPYNKPTPAGLKAHFLSIADSLEEEGSNIVLYDVPSRTGVPLPAELVIELAQDERFIGIKYASDDFDRLGEIYHGTKDKEFNILSGEDSLVAKMRIYFNATGVISAAANVAPAMFKKMVEYALDDDHTRAFEVQRELEGVISATFFEGTSNPEALAYLFGSGVRLPLTPLTEKFGKEAQAQDIDTLMGNYTHMQLGINLNDYRRS